MLRLVGPAAASFGLCLLAIFALRPLAIAVDLIDRPGGRKTHQGEVPIVGGLAMFMGIVLGLGLLPTENAAGSTFLAACSVLVAIGLIDDRFELSPWARLCGQVSAALVLIVGAGALVTGLGDPFGTGGIQLGTLASLGFTVLITTAAINAFNMLDGMDGLAGATALVALITLAALASSGGLIFAAGVSMVIAGAVCSFLLFNLPMRANRKMRCFMGDAGSTLLGFAVAWLCIQVSQGATKVVSPVTTLWIVALPLFELVWSTVRRVVRGVSPFRADALHFHHLLRSAGFGVRGAFAAFVILTVLFTAVGLLLDHFGATDHASFLLLIAAGAGTVSFMYRAHLVWRVIPESLRRLPPLDQGHQPTP